MNPSTGSCGAWTRVNSSGVRRVSVGALQACIALAMNCACAPTSVRQSETVKADELDAHSSESVLKVTDFRNGASAQYEHFLRQFDHMYDVSNLALAKEQVPPVGFRPLDLRATPFPGKAFASVEGYFVGSTLGKSSPGPDNAVSGCPGAVATDGTLCPEVLLPGHRLSASQIKRLLAVPTPSDPPIVTSCARPNTHAWVFYDEQGTPVGQLRVNFACKTWSRGVGRLPNATMRIFRGLCAESGVEGCWLGSEPNEYPQWHQAWSDWNKTRFLPSYWPQNRYMNRVLRATQAGVAASTRQQDLSPRDKRVLCQWSLQHAAWFLRAGDSWGYEARDVTLTLSVLRWEQCVAEFPTCNLPLGTLLPCMQHAQRGDPWFRKPEGAECKRYAACMWGFRADESANLPEPTRPEPTRGATSPTVAPRGFRGVPTPLSSNQGGTLPSE